MGHPGKSSGSFGPFRIFWKIILLTAMLGNASGRAVLYENGYEGIVVAIGDHVKENATIIDNIKRMFTEGSSVLYTATRQRAYFKEITIVVPATWQRKDEYMKTQGSGWLTDADIRIDLPHPAHNAAPYTLQLGGCGEEGAYTHLSEEYVTDMYGRLQGSFGPPGKVLVHEWAHLRWGVFDEYGKHGTFFPAFYLGENLEVHSTGCTEDLKGWLLEEDGGKCQATANGLPDTKCHFYPRASQENINGSFMSFYFLDSVTQFCDDEDVPHNSFAPSPQNLRCDGRSTWSVITSHEDFKDNNNPPRSNWSIPDLTPKFQVIHEQPKQKPRFIMLLDLSASMDVYMKKFYQEVVRFVRDLIPTGSQIAVISFANESLLNVDFTEVTDSNREDIVQKIPKDYMVNGYTAIGAAMQSGLELIDKEEIKSEGLMFVLVTDGHETMHPLVYKVLPEIKRRGIIINTVSLGPNATDSLECWASETGGSSYYHRTDATSSASTLDALLLDSISKSIVLSEELLQVYREVIQVTEGKDNFVEEEVVLDSSLGHLTRFTFTEIIDWHNTFSIKVKLSSPDGMEYSKESQSTIYSEDKTTQTITFTIPDAKPGKWLYRVTNLPGKPEPPFKDNVFVAVTSYPSHKTPEEPIRVKMWMTASNIQYPDPAPVYALVSQGYSIILNANVTAIVDPPTHNSTISLQLFDDGVGADMQAGDGIYSAFFTQFSGDGRYSLSAVVSTTNLTTKLLGNTDGQQPLPLNSPGINAMRIPISPVPENSLPQPAESSFDRKDLVPPQNPDQEGKRIDNKNLDKFSIVEPFSRFTSGGIFKVTNYRPGDMSPPGRVTDLTVVSSFLYEATVKLRWTSPGDDWYNGRASFVELRYHDTRKISDDFSIGHPVNESHLVSGDLRPLMAGEPHEITIHMTERRLEDLENRAIYFCLRARDEVGNLGNISNLARAYFPFREYARNLKEEQRVHAITGLVVLGVIGFIIVLIVSFIAIVKLLHFRNRKRKRTQELRESAYRYYS